MLGICLALVNGPLWIERLEIPAFSRVSRFDGRGEERESLKVDLLSFCALQPGALKLSVQMTPASRQSSPPVSPSFVIDFDGFFFLF